MLKARAKGLKLNLGSGETRIKGFINLDKIDLPTVDVVWDLEKTPLPFEKDSVSEIICDHVMEHIHNFVPLMEEIHRICKPGAVVRISVPYYKYEGAFRDPTHVRFFSERSFEYFTEKHSLNYYTNARFNVRKTELKITSKTNVINLYKRLVKFIPMKRILNPFLWNLYTEIYFELGVEKPNGGAGGKHESSWNIPTEN